jgi:hypothetical protein
MKIQMPRLLILPFLLVAASVGAKPTPAGLFTDHCVLQRDLPIPVWGKAHGIAPLSSNSTLK